TAPVRFRSSRTVPSADPGSPRMRAPPIVGTRRRGSRWPAAPGPSHGARGPLHKAAAQAIVQGRRRKRDARTVLVAGVATCPAAPSASSPTADDATPHEAPCALPPRPTLAAAPRKGPEALAPFAPGTAVLRIGDGYVFGEDHARPGAAESDVDVLCEDIREQT